MKSTNNFVQNLWPFSSLIKKKEIYTEILIKAPAPVVWNVLTDFENYPNWNPFIKSLKGDLAVGKRIRVSIEGMTFKPQILVCEKNRELRWLGNLLFRGLFDGEHRFLLIDHGDGTTTFQHSEQFEGILVGIFARQLAQTKTGFELMNQKLKEQAESSSSGE